MAFEKDLSVLEEVTGTVEEIRKGAGTVCRKNSVGTDLLNEDPSAFGTGSLLFEEISAALLDETEDLFALSRCCDRFAPQYLKICRILERSVEHLGGVFITKTALLCRKYELPKLEVLSAERLNEMISFNFRKCKAALDEIKQTRHEFDLELYAQMLSFAKVMERLRATQRKAHDINIGIVDVYRLMKDALYFTDKDLNRGYAETQCRPSAYRRAPSYAADRAVLLAAAADEEVPVIEAPEAVSEETKPKAQPAGPEGPSEAYHPTPDDVLPDPGGVPAYVRLIQTVMKREEGSESGECTFTEDEMKWLVSDPEFCEDNPELAEDLRQDLLQIEQYRSAMADRFPDEYGRPPERV